jgi:hypothetical protein
MELLVQALLDSDKMLLVLWGLVFFIICIFIFYHKDKTHPQFDITDMVMEGGHVSKTAVFLVCSFILTSWMMVYLTIDGDMNPGYFSIYIGAWIAPIMAKIVKGPSVPPEDEKSEIPPKDNNQAIGLADLKSAAKIEDTSIKQQIKEEKGKQELKEIKDDAKP